MKRLARIASPVAFTLAALALAASPLAAMQAESEAQDMKEKALSPGEIIAAAAPDEWVDIADHDLLIMALTPDAEGQERRVVIQLLPEPFAHSHVDNIRKLARARWWDGTSINRVQDNYVVQWGDASEEKPLPSDLVTVPESEYETLLSKELAAQLSYLSGLETLVQIPDVFAEQIVYLDGWPLGFDGDSFWPVHCYGMVGVGRNLSPDTGSGAELYTVIGHAPRHLDRNIALVGRIIEGMEHLSSLPRGKGTLGFYEDESKRTPIQSIRLATSWPAEQRDGWQYLDTGSRSFSRYAEARANRRDAFFNLPAGAADVCNIAVPVRKSP